MGDRTNETIKQNNEPKVSEEVFVLKSEKRIVFCCYEDPFCAMNLNSMNLKRKICFKFCFSLLDDDERRITDENRIETDVLLEKKKKFTRSF